MDKEPKPTGWYQIPYEDTDRVLELNDGSLLFEDRSGQPFTALPGQWYKSPCLGYRVQYSVLYAEWEQVAHPDTD